MESRTLRLGETVRTRDGEVGRIIKPTGNGLFTWREYRLFDLEGKADLVVYTLLLQSGEVRQFSFDAIDVAR
ncbi:hypothetical protein [Marisediminicola sp. LYQ85]|uniref:hypothetical protein n=1 Tax=Marisediminicola sp. LYQ85 TaxID=3391062 RepID=UPI003983CFA5